MGVVVEAVIDGACEAEVFADGGAFVRLATDSLDIGWDLSDGAIELALVCGLGAVVPLILLVFGRGSPLAILSRALAAAVSLISGA